MITSTQGATRLDARRVPNRVLGFRWVFPTATFTVNQRWHLPITVTVIVVLATLVAHSHPAMTAYIRAFTVNSNSAVVALDNLTTRGAPVASHRSHRSWRGCVRHTCGVQELRFPQDSDAFPLSHARGAPPLDRP